VAHGAERVHRAQTGGAQGEGAAMVKHHDGGRIRARPPFVEAYRKITRALARLIVDLARFMTLADIAGWLSLSWDTVRTVVQRRLEKDYRRIGYRKVRAIAIDELYLGRARKYVTLVIDLQSGRIIWVEQGRGSQALREFWRRFKLSGARLKAVAMDMSGAYAASVRAHAPHPIMINRFSFAVSCLCYLVFTAFVQGEPTTMESPASAAEFTAPATATPKSYEFSCMIEKPRLTSAGIFDSSGRLVRVLWTMKGGGGPDQGVVERQGQRREACWERRRENRENRAV
jgi:Transposase/Helix-turn-helix domain of transposase family ISL3